MQPHHLAEEPGLFDLAPESDPSSRTPASKPIVAEEVHSNETHRRGHQSPDSNSDGTLAAANERADHLEAEIAELKALVETMAQSRGKSSRRTLSPSPDREEHIFSAQDGKVKNQAADALSRAVRGRAAGVPDDAPATEREQTRGFSATTSTAATTQSKDQAPSPAHRKGGIPVHDGSNSGDSPARRQAQSLVEDQDDASATKQPPSPSTAEGLPGVSGGEAELRNDSMMAHLLDSLDAGEDIGHYGRLVFAMVARHFLAHEDVLAWLLKDQDLGEEEGRQMLLQVEQRDYSPPRRDRILTWQAEQSFPILPNVDDPDCGNLYRTLNFPQAIYQHIGHYREQKAEAGE